jgi:hypothetical protein
MRLTQPILELVMIEVKPNKTMFGKRSKDAPFVATLNSVDAIAYGKTALDARLAALTVLESAYTASQAPMVFRVAKDGTVFVARWTSHDQMEYYIVRGNAFPGSCLGRCDQSLQSYMDKVLAEYDACTVPDSSDVSSLSDSALLSITEGGR